MSGEMSDTPNDEAADTTTGPAAGEISDAAADTATGRAVAAPTQQPSKRRRRSLIALSVLALIAGVAGSWAFNRGEPTRQDRNTAIIQAAVDPSTYVTPGDYDNLTVPIRNDSPYAVTVIGLYLPTAPKLLWDGAWTVIQPGGTADLRVQAPFGCAAIPHPLKRTGSVPVLVRVLTVNGDSHASLRTSISGVIQYAADYCPAPTKKKA